VQEQALSPDLLTACQTSMQRGSLSFFLAARLAGARLRTGLMVLYSWCRFCDDAVDACDQSEAIEQRTLAVDELRRQTWSAMHGGTKPLLQKDQPAAFAAFHWLTQAYRIPDHYPQELLAGMDMDVAGQRYVTYDDLRLYCYRVAGVVGLMFSHLAGVSDERALQNAADLGMAMQLTNIARDVLTDLELGRVYLPDEWLMAAGLTTSDIGDVSKRAQLVAVVERMLSEADHFYASGEAGLKYLPWRAALAAGAARFIYAEIGQLVRRRGVHAWDQRAVVPLPRKLFLVCRAILLVLRQRRGGLQGRWQPVTIRDIRRFS